VTVVYRFAFLFLFYTFYTIVFILNIYIKFKVV